MSDGLTIDDADGLRDLADRSERAARTATRSAAATDDEAMTRALATMSERLDDVVVLARYIASRLDPEGDGDD